MGSTKADKVKKVAKTGKEAEQANLEGQVPGPVVAQEVIEQKPDGRTQDREREERAQKAQNALLQIEGNKLWMFYDKN